MNRSCRVVVALVLTLGAAVTLSACSKSTGPTPSLNTYETALVGHWRFTQTTDSTGTFTLDYTVSADRNYGESVSRTGSPAGNGSGTGGGTWSATDTKIFTTTTNATGDTAFKPAMGVDSVGYALAGAVLTITDLGDGTVFVLNRQ